MVLIFDLDDTLYEERDYLTSGFWAVARRLEAQFGWDRDASYRCMMEVMEEQGRGAVFNRLLERHGKMSEALVRDCVKFYRHHPPEIHLLPAAMELLPKLSGSPLYLVTDGHKIVQDHKMRALGIESRFRKVYLTHRYGIRHAKPSPHCFERIREREGCGWEQMVYVGDNPAKDFVGLTPLGVHTVRVLTGRHRLAVAATGYEARYRLPDLTHLPGLLEEIRI